EPSVSWFCFALEEIFTTIETFDLEFLAGFNIIFPPYFRRKNDLTLSRDCRSHEGKITSYLARGQSTPPCCVRAESGRQHTKADFQPQQDLKSRLQPPLGCERAVCREIVARPSALNVRCPTTG